MGLFDRIAGQLGDLMVPDDVRMHVELAVVSLERGDVELAVRELTRAVERAPEHARAWYLLGVAQERRKDPVAAEAALERAVELRSDFAEALLLLAEVRRRLGHHEEAAEAIRRALEGGLDDGASRAAAYRALGSSYLAQGRLDKAIRELRKAVAEAPDDGEAQGLLGRALLARGDHGMARLCLERAAAAKPPPPGLGETLLALGDLSQRAGRSADAEAAFARALEVEPRLLAARVGLATVQLGRGDAAEAHQQALALLADFPAAPEGHLLTARALAQIGSHDLALPAYERALAATPEAAQGPLLVEALRAALRAGDVRRGAALAGRLLLREPSHPDGVAAAALAAIDGGDLAAAAALLEGAQGDSVELRLAWATLEQTRDRPAAAAAALRRAVEIAGDDERPRLRLRALTRASREHLPEDLNGLLRSAHRLLLGAPELSDLAPDAARIVELVDRPLLVTVMGEFNSGKSTFVNALLGEEVAPMGITPTTATINVLKYGAERGGRVVYRDESTREVAWSEVPGLLRGLDGAEARRIRWVEVLYPLETLQRVNVVDTPGLNSILPEHEETAREYIAQADAMVWLFTCGQPGKASEREALERIQREGKRVLGVVNKIDRTDEAGVAEVLQHLSTSFRDLVETLVPFSAREALLGLKDPERLRRSNRAELHRVLDERFFARAQSIKLAAARRRLGALLDEARARAERQGSADRRRSIDDAGSAVRAEALLFQRHFLDQERGRLTEELAELWSTCAREVLDFVRPRRWVFGSNQAAPADRDFLVGLIEEKLGRLNDRSRARVAEEAGRIEATLVPILGPIAIEPLRMLDEQVYGRHQAFARGYLRGGRVDDFFTRVLPKLELTEAAIQRALGRDMPNLEVIEAELLIPLGAWGERFYAALRERLDSLARAEDRRRLEVEERLLWPLEGLRGALGDPAA